MSDRTAANQNRRRQTLAMIIVSLLFVGVGAAEFWRWQSNRVPAETMIEEPGSARGGFTGFPAVRPMQRDGVVQVGKNYELRASNALIRISKDAHDQWQFDFSYHPPKFSSPDQVAFLLVRMQSLSLKLSGDQLKQLNALPRYRGGMVVSADDRAKIEKLWNDYIAANPGSKPAAETALVQALTAVGADSVAPTLAATDEHVAKIKAILTPEQIAKVSHPAGAPTPRAAQPRAATTASVP